MLRSILALFFVLSTQTIASDIESTIGSVQIKENHQTPENQSSRFYSFVSNIAFFANNAISSLNTTSKNILKMGICHVNEHSSFYSTIGHVCLAAVSMKAANAFSANDCPGYYPEWRCPNEIWLCSNGTETPNVPFAFVGCSENLEPIISGMSVNGVDCPDENCLLRKKVEQAMLNLESKFFSNVFTNTYNSLRENNIVYYEGQCAFPLSYTLNIIQGCFYSISNFMGTAGTHTVMFVKM